MTTVDTLRAARARIDTPAKWRQDDYGTGDEHYGVCAIGALYLACGVRAAGPYRRDQAPVFQALHRAVFGTDAEQKGGSWYAPGEFEITAWNDTDGRMHADVLAAFDRAIANELAREQEHTATPVPSTVLVAA